MGGSSENFLSGCAKRFDRSSKVFSVAKSPQLVGSYAVPYIEHVNYKLSKTKYRHYPKPKNGFLNGFYIGFGSGRPISINSEIQWEGMGLACASNILCGLSVHHTAFPGPSPLFAESVVGDRVFAGICECPLVTV